MITVHYLNNSRAHRILWLLEELGLEYEIKTYQRAADMRAPDALKSIHPMGKSPVLTDGDVVMAESGAITEYLLHTYGDGKLVPAIGTPEWRRYIYWLHAAEGSVMPLMQMKVTFRVIQQKVPFFLKPSANLIVNAVSRSLLDPQLAGFVKLWEAELSKGGWFAGDAFSAADIQMSFPVEAGITRVDYGDVPATRAFLDAIRSRPAYQRALAKGGAYEYATTIV